MSYYFLALLSMAIGVFIGGRLQLRACADIATWDESAYPKWWRNALIDAKVRKDKAK